LNQKFLIYYKNMNDLILVKNIQEGIDEEFSLEKLYNLHSKIFYKMVNTFIADTNKSLKEELFKECKYHIYFAAKNFNFEKNTKFSTYLANIIKWTCLNLNLKNKRSINNFFSEIGVAQEDEDEDQNFIKLDERSKIINNEIIEKVFSIAKSHSDDRIFKIFELRYKDGNKNKVMPWKLVSRQIGMSIQGCINIHNNFIRDIKKGQI
tara:strand:+ start:1522 stop:2142 length:621 start_codon:yes stop_codon:yes gene_type:complete